jgi:hypothetical protein
MVCESKIIYGIEMWGLNGAWEEADKVPSRFCKKVIGIPNCTESGFAEMELARVSRGGKCL